MGGGMFHQGRFVKFEHKVNHQDADKEEPKPKLGKYRPNGKTKKWDVYDGKKWRDAEEFYASITRKDEGTEQ